MVALIVSCSKDATNDEDAMLKKAVATGPSAPFSYGPDGLPTGTDGIIPQIIPGANNGGNRTCAEVAAWKGLSADYFRCGDKVDYNNGTFASAFPSGLDVTITAGKYVSFKMDNCIQFGDKFYRVGAVIVKGSNAANVYYYPGGTMSDSGLASPLNNSSNPAGLSNLTFCFVECKLPKMVIAFKGQMVDGWARTVGSVDYYIDFAPNIGNKIFWMADINLKVGNILISDIDSDGLWEVTIDNTDRPGVLLIHDAHLFVGTLEQFNSIPSAYYYPYQLTFSIPTSSLTFELSF